MKYLLLLNKDYFYYYIFMHPEVMEDQNIRDRLITNYLRDNSFRRETRDYYHDRYSPTFVNNLRRLTYANIYQSFQKYNRNHNRHNDININIREDQLKRDLWQELNERYKNIHENHIKDIEEKPPSKDKPIKEDKLSDAQKRIDDILKKHREQMDKRHRKVQKDAENKVQLYTELMKPKDERKKYKIWNQHPNPKTRHTITNGQKVPIEEKFEVINDKTGIIDLMDCPGDSKGSIGNIANCYCTMSFTNDNSNLYNPKKYSVKDAYEELSKKTEKLKKLLSMKGIKLTNDATLLAKKEDLSWIITNLKLGYKQHRRMRITDINKALLKRDELLEIGYLKNDFNLEIAHGKIWLEHTTVSRDLLNLDRLTNTTNSHSYNIIAQLLRGRRLDLNSYSIEEKNALDFYSRDEYFTTFNSWQRNNYSDEIIEIAINDETSRLYGYDKIELKELFKKNYDVLKNMQIELNEDMIMYHGQKSLYDSDGKELKEVGEWNNTISLGLFRQSGEKYATDDEGNKHILYRVYVPKGTKITPILQMSKQEYVDESEVLLGKGYRYKVDHYYIENGFSVRDSRLL